MKSAEFSLERLLRAAARVPEALPAEAPYQVELRVLAVWRRGLAADPSVIFLPLVRKAFLCACAILVISAAVSLKSWTEAPPNELFIVDSAIQFTLTHGQ